MADRYETADEGPCAGGSRSLRNGLDHIVCITIGTVAVAHETENKSVTRREDEKRKLNATGIKGRIG